MFILWLSLHLGHVSSRIYLASSVRLSSKQYSLRTAESWFRTPFMSYCIHATPVFVTSPTPFPTLFPHPLPSPPSIIPPDILLPHPKYRFFFSFPSIALHNALPISLPFLTFFALCPYLGIAITLA